MARISADGAREVGRVSIVRELDAAEAEKARIRKKRVEFCITTSGRVLRKITVWWKEKPRYGGPDWHSWGWKVYGKLKAGADAEAVLRRIAEKKAARGFKVATSFTGYKVRRSGTVRAEAAEAVGQVRGL